jgi:hypothetical protein
MAVVLVVQSPTKRLAQSSAHNNTVVTAAALPLLIPFEMSVLFFATRPPSTLGSLKIRFVPGLAS